MSNTTLRFPENAPGAFFTTEDCIDCDLCRQIAPRVFHRHDGIGASIVAAQPSSPESLALTREALGECPVEAICESPTDV